MKEPKMIGSFELVGFPELGEGKVVAKIDTGAFSGTIHATNIIEVKNDQGDRVLQFAPFGNTTETMTVTDFKLKQIRSSNGQLETRYVITTKIILQDQEYPITISLADRSAMMKSVLIGRQFLRRHHFIVDVRQGTQYAYAVKESDL